MKRRRILWESCVLMLCLCGGYLLQGGQVSHQPRKADAGAVPAVTPAVSYAKLPLSFEANQGQTDARVKFLSRGPGYTLFLTGDGVALELQESEVRSQKSGVRIQDSVRGRLPRSLSLLPQLKDAGPLETDHGRRTTDNRRSSVLRLKLLDANQNAAVTRTSELPGKANYFLGNDPKKWRSNVPTYAKVKYQGVYPGVDLVFYGNQRQLEYDFVLAPGADPNFIKLGIQGTHGIHIDERTGDLVLETGGGEVRLHKPHFYQLTRANANGHHGQAGPRNPNPPALDGRYVLESKNAVKFEIAAYDPKRPLIIDPVLTYSTYLGGSGFDWGYGIAVDAGGNSYVTGDTDSVDFPTSSPIQGSNGGGEDVFVTKINPTGSALVYSTYLGGSGLDSGQSIAVDSSGDAYITGETQSTDFPTMNPFQPANHGGRIGYDVFVTKISPAGSTLVYSTYLGGTGDDWAGGIVVDSAGNAFVAGTTDSTDLPTMNPLQNSNHGNYDVFITKINATGSALVYSTFLGGANEDWGNATAVDSAGNAYVSGWTGSTDFPTVNPFQNTNRGHNAFLTKVNPVGSSLVYSTYLGGSGGDWGLGVGIDAAGDAYVGGYTTSTDFPTFNPFQASNHGGADAFVTKFNPEGTNLLYSTYLGGSGNECSESPCPIAVDAAGNAYIGGQTVSSDFPLFHPVQSAYGGAGDAFLAGLNPSGSSLIYSTYLGGSGSDLIVGIALDSAGDAYVTGATTSTNFPTVNPLQSAYGGGSFDVFVAKLSLSPAVSLSANSLSFGSELVSSTSNAQSVTLTNGGDAALTVSISITGDFEQTNNCGSSVAAGGSCTINVTFTPTAGGNRSGMLTITDNNDGVAGSTQTVNLAGTGQDFTLAPATGSSSSATVSPGGTATYTLTATSVGGFNQAVSLACTGAPSEATCQLSQTSLTPSSSGTNVTVTVTTTAPSVSAPRSRPFPPTRPLTPWPESLVMLALFLSGAAWAAWNWSQPGVSRLRTGSVALALGMLLTLAMAGCGGGGGGKTSNPGTPAGTYTITVTGSTGSGSSALSHSVKLTLTVS